MKKNEKQMTKNNSLFILKNQINLLKKRKSKFKNITISDFENFNFMEKIKSK